MKRGAGRIRCEVCGREAAAKGDGKPIVLRHKPNCPEQVEFTVAARSEESGSTQDSTR